MKLENHENRTFFKNGRTYCAFCKERSDWCGCKGSCEEGYHKWADNAEICCFCLLSKKDYIEDSVDK